MIDKIVFELSFLILRDAFFGLLTAVFFFMVFQVVFCKRQHYTRKLYLMNDEM